MWPSYGLKLANPDLINKISLKHNFTYLLYNSGLLTVSYTFRPKRAIIKLCIQI